MCVCGEGLCVLTLGGGKNAATAAPSVLIRLIIADQRTTQGGCPPGGGCWSVVVSWPIGRVEQPGLISIANDPATLNT